MGTANLPLPQPRKRRSARRYRRLTYRDVQTLPDGMHSDADVRGLYLNVAGRSRSWILRYMLAGRRRDMGLGSVRDLSLEQARHEARKWRELLRRKIDPLAEKKRAEAEEAAKSVQQERQKKLEKWTFKKVAREVHETLEPSWKNAKHAKQWITTLETYAFPTLGDKPVGDVTVDDVERVLRPIWHAKRETAQRLAQRMRAVIQWAIDHEYAQRDVVSIAIRHLGKVRKQVEHHEAVPYPDVPAFIEKLRALTGVATSTKLALEFQILTVVRPGEVRFATWREIERKARIWTIPADRMKASVAHRVPLSDRAIEVLNAAAKLSDGKPDTIIFPGDRARIMSDSTTSGMMRKKMGVDATPHGFRSSFRDWCAETGVPHNVAERALAHTVKNAVEAAYYRTDQLEQRRPVMQAWADFITGKTTADGKVIPLRRRAVTRR